MDARQVDGGPGTGPIRYSSHKWWRLRPTSEVRSSAGRRTWPVRAVRCSIAAVLSVPGLGLREGLEPWGIADRPSGLEDLRQLRASRQAVLGVRPLGRLVNEPLYWDRERDRLERSPFLQGGTQPQG
jgi:hypothetical protein